MDPEPLIIHTAGLGDEDPRLRDEVTDWCIKCWGYVSGVRLRNMLRDQSEDLQEKFGEFSATVNAHAYVKWPGATQARPYRPTGRSNLPSLEDAAMVALRLRAIFGVGARTEILRHLLRDRGSHSVATLSGGTGYAKRNVAEECESLERSGVLAVTTVANRFYYSLDRRAELIDFVGDQPEVWPSWEDLLTVADAFVELEDKATVTPAHVMAVEATKALEGIMGDLIALGVDGPGRPAQILALWPSTESWARGLMASWAAGRWPAGAGLKRTIGPRTSRKIVRSAPAPGTASAQ